MIFGPGSIYKLSALMKRCEQVNRGLTIDELTIAHNTITKRVYKNGGWFNERIRHHIECLFGARIYALTIECICIRIVFVPVSA